jgi:PKD repeat protein
MPYPKQSLSSLSTKVILTLLPMLLGFLFMTPVQAKDNATQSAQAADEIYIVINPPTLNVNVGDTFVSTIQVQAGNLEVNGVSAYVDFDPSLLEVRSMTPVTNFSSIFQNNYDNTTGQINYAGGTISAPFPTGTFDLLQVEFEVIGQFTDTSIAFQTVNPRLTDVTARGIGANLTGSTDSTVTMQQGGSIVADFTCTPSSGVAPLSVTCSDASTGDITGWSWAFGAGTTSPDQNPPAHLYGTDGEFNITLTTTGSDGSDSKTAQIVVGACVPSPGSTTCINIVSAGELSVESQNVIFPNTSIAGFDVLAYAIDQRWVATDTTGFAAGWHVTLQAEDHFRGSEEPNNRVIPVGSSGNFGVSCSNDEITPLPGVPHAGNLPTCASGVQSIPNAALGESAISILSATVNDARGAYNFIPHFQLVVPGTTIIDLYSTNIYVDLIQGP